ncbi:type VI secretion system baseplate subunit TssG [Niveispirillum irakense]|uniref:type VI secretion system baseplate subunit TssG n=1 Tax=Niveispirillum irakense TaxID=34011 RepID=UPI00041315B1|nr:type VI secretion system baseplate subunit TssG [Niveispirillum irakense]
MSHATNPPPLIDLLRDQPQRFDLFRAVQLLERQLTAANEDGNDSDLPVRFSANASLSFPAHEIQRLSLPGPGEEGDGRAGMALNLMTLTGPVSALPQVYTETIIRSLKDRTPGFAAFLDLFNDRIGALFFQAWRRYRLPALYERHGLSGSDPATMALLSMAGFGTAHLRGRLSVRDEVMVYFAGLFSQQPRAAVSLERMLADACGVPVQVRQFHGRWIAIPASEQTCLQGSFGQLGGYNRLGVDSVAGARMWDVQGRFRLILGPLSRRQFQDHLPGAAGLKRLVELTRLYVGAGLDFDVQLILRRDDVPDCVLDSHPTAGVRLGYDGWLSAFPMVRDPDDTVIDVSGIDEC